MIIKQVYYNNLHEAVFIDGKFSTLILNYMFSSDTTPSFVKTAKDIYFVHDGVLYFAPKVQIRFELRDDEMYRSGKMKQLLDSNDIFGKRTSYAPCDSIRGAFSKIRDLTNGLPRRTHIQISSGSAILIHNPYTMFIEVQYLVDDDCTEVLMYHEGSFTYGLCTEMLYEGYPDMEDSSTGMNLILSGANVQNIQVLVNLFNEYTKRMDIRRE